MKRKFFKFTSVFLALIMTITGLNLNVFAVQKLSTPKVSIGIITKGYPAIKLSWKQVSGANTYYIYRSEKVSGSLNFIASTSKLYYKDKNVVLNKTYYYKIIAYKIVNKKIKSKSDASPKVSAAVVRLDTPKIEIINSTEDSITLQTIKYKNATGYYLYYATSENGKYTNVGYIEKDTYTIKNLKSSTKYYFKAKAVKKLDGKVYGSEYSNVVSAKTNNKNGEFIADFVKIPNDDKLPGGEALNCLAMTMASYGINVTSQELLDCIGYDDNFYYKDGKLFGPNHEVCFVGDPTKKNNKYFCGLSRRMMRDLAYLYQYRSGLGVSIDFDIRVFIGDENNFKRIASLINDGKVVWVTYCLENQKDNKVKWNYYDEQANLKIIEEYSSKRYAVICGYTNDEFILYDPKNDQFENVLKEDFFILDAGIYIDF